MSNIKPLSGNPVNIEQPVIILASRSTDIPLSLRLADLQDQSRLCEMEESLQRRAHKCILRANQIVCVLD
jgi:hypothetical protein